MNNNTLAINKIAGLLAVLVFHARKTTTDDEAHRELEYHLDSVSSAVSRSMIEMVAGDVQNTEHPGKIMFTPPSCNPDGTCGEECPVLQHDDDGEFCALSLHNKRVNDASPCTPGPHCPACRKEAQ